LLCCGFGGHDDVSFARNEPPPPASGSARFGSPVRPGRNGLGSNRDWRNSTMRIITVLSGLAALSLAACGQGEGGDASGGRSSASVQAAMAEGPAPGLWRVTTRIGDMSFPPMES